MIILPLFGLNAIADDTVLVEPVPSASAELEKKPARTLDYSDQLIDIKDRGLFDVSGRPVSKWNTEAAPNAAVPLNTTEKLENSAGESAEVQKTILNRWGSEQDFAEGRLNVIKDQLQDARGNFQELTGKVKELEDAIGPLNAKIDTLKDQIDLFNVQIGEAQARIQYAEAQIVRKQMDIKELMNDLEISRVTLSAQQKTVLEFIALMYHEEEQYLNLYDHGADTFKLFLADRSVGESLQGQDYLVFIEALGRDFFHELQFKHRDLAEKQNDLQKQQQSLAVLYEVLSSQKADLKVELLAKKDLLDKTQGEEKRYQELLEEALQQQMDSVIVIQNMKDNIAYIEGRLSTLDDTLPVPAIDESQGNFESMSLPAPTDLLPSVSSLESYPLEWPVGPERGISAYFRDEDYPKRWGTHQAIDIRVPQGTPIRAPANSYVFQVKDNGLGYSYIILAHKGNLVSVYGHVSEILVKPGMVLKKGEIIGMTGGMPGTKGAGLQTTGPHLHFEVYRNGQHINPLDVLPVFQLPIRFIPEEYLKKL